ncbi:MAG: glucose-1-phosphate thymidylyltransferase RfbA [Bacilli bacterium]
MKGIILAGGSGKRLYPLTLVTSKQLLPIYDKPMIYYPLSTLMLAGIKDILIISTPVDTPRMKELLGDGSKFGINLSYEIQKAPSGIVEAFIIGKQFIDNDSCALILGDNIFYGAGLIRQLKESASRADNGIATIFGYFVKDPSRYGVVEFDKENNAISIEEKPKNPKSNYCATGLYFYPKDVVESSTLIKPSKRGELEITDLNNLYLNKKTLFVATLGRGYSWIDAGTHESLVDASNYVKILEEHQGIKISCPEEIAFVNGWISKEMLILAGESMKSNEYGKHLLNVADGKIKY